MSNETPTDALRLVPTDEMIRLGAWRAKLHREANPGDTWEETAREVFIFMSAAAPASPLPEGDGTDTEVPSGWLIRDTFDADPEAWFYTVHEDQAREYADDGVPVFSLPKLTKLPAAPTGAK